MREDAEGGGDRKGRAVLGVGLGALCGKSRERGERKGDNCGKGEQ